MFSAYFTGDLPFEFYSSIFINELEVFKNGNALLIIRQQLQILVRYETLKL